MEIWDAGKLVLFIAFVIPGFVTLKIYELAVPSERTETAKQLIDAIAYSCINYALLAAPIYWVETWRPPFPTFVYGLLWASVLFVGPALWPFLWIYVRRTSLAQRLMIHLTGKPWDYVFGKRTPYWVIVTLKDGKQLAGRYDVESFASSTPAPEQLYLEEAWVLNEDGGFERKRNDTAGIIITSSEFLTVELFHMRETEYGEQTSQASDGPRRLQAVE